MPDQTEADRRAAVEARIRGAVENPPGVQTLLGIITDLRAEVAMLRDHSTALTDERDAWHKTACRKAAQAHGAEADATALRDRVTALATEYGERWSGNYPTVFPDAVARDLRAALAPAPLDPKNGANADD